MTALPGTRGQKNNLPEEFLEDMISPYTRNMEFSNNRLQARYGLSKVLATALNGPILTQAQLVKFDNTRYEIFCTPDDIYKLDLSNSRFDYITPTYAVGTVKVVNGSAIVRGGLSVDTCDTDPVAWADGSAGDVTPSRETSSPQDGTAFVRLTVGAGAGVELLAYRDIASVNLSSYDSVGFWIRSSVTTSAGDIRFVLDNTAACASPLETINIPALTANTWTWVNLAFVTPGNLTAVISIGITQAVDIGACTIDIDQIVVGDWSDKIAVGDKFKVGNSDIHTGATYYTVLTVDSDTQITLTAVYAGSSANQQTYAIRLLFNGGNTDFFDWVQFQDQNLGEVLVLTNGVDAPVYYTGSGQCVIMTSLPTSLTAAKYVSVFAGRLLLAWTVEGGQNQPQRLQGSEPFDITTWDEDAFPIDFVDEPTEVRGMTKFGNYHILFKESNCYVGRFVGGDFVLNYELSQQCKGVRSPWSIVARNDFIYYYANDKKFKRFNLLSEDIISEDNFPDTVNFDPNQDEFVQGYDVIRKNQVRWFCPNGSATQHNYVAVYDYLFGVYLPWEYQHADACCSMGSILRTSDAYFDDASLAAVYFDGMAGYFDDSSLLDSAPLIIYGGYDGYLRYADNGSDDDGTEFTRLLRLKRFSFDMPDNVKRLWTQQWWLQAAPSGSVTAKLLKNDKTSYESGSKTISLIPDDANQDVVKRNVTWDVRGYNFQPEISATIFFAVNALINYYFKKHTTQRN